MNLKARIAALESMQSDGRQAIPENLSSRDRYLFMIQQKGVTRPKTNNAPHLTPEEAYRRMTGNA